MSELMGPHEGESQLQRAFPN